MEVVKTTQQQIVSQSQLERSLEFLKAQKVTFDLKQLIAVSAVLEDYVQNGWTKELNGRVSNLDKWLNEARTSKPFED